MSTTSAPQTATDGTTGGRAPRQRVFLHVGLPKTGTTYLQDRLWLNRESARDAGLLYPGLTAQDHFHAACHLQPERYLAWVDPAQQGIWNRLLDQIRDWPATTLISHELFASATEEQARRVLADLSFAEVHIVCTVRDIARQIPSVWQENVKNQHTSGFEEFVASIKDTDPATLRDPFWEFQELPRILRTWGSGVEPGHVHVVTVPPRGSSQDQLLERVLGVLDIPLSALPEEVRSDNASLGAAQVEMLRRMNEHLRPDAIDWPRYEQTVKRFLVGDILFDTPDRRLFSLRPEDLSWAGAQSDRFIDAIVDAGYDVVGDLAELRPDPDGTVPADATEDTEVLALAIDTLAKIMKQMPLASPPPPPSLLARVKAKARAGVDRLPVSRR